MKNLIKNADWYNPFTAITTNGNGYELNKIHFYNEDGIILSTASGWFDEKNNGNNSFNNGVKIDDIHLRNKVNFDKKENFIVKNNNDYNIFNRYDLYIYYKNVDFKTHDIVISCNISGNYSIKLEDIVLNCNCYLGSATKKSDEVRYKYYDMIDNLKNFKYGDISELIKKVKELEKTIKQYEKIKEFEKDDVKNNTIDYIYDKDINLYKYFIENKENGSLANE